MCEDITLKFKEKRKIEVHARSVSTFKKTNLLTNLNHCCKSIGIDRNQLCKKK